MDVAEKRDNWMGLVAFEPAFCCKAEDLDRRCILANGVVSGHPLEHVLVAFNRWDNEWEMMPPVLIGVNGHWIAIVNTKFDEVSVSVDDVDPKDGFVNWALECEWAREGETVTFDWDVVWREYPLSKLIGQKIRRIEPLVEADPYYANFGLLCGAAVVLETDRLEVYNALDENGIRVRRTVDEQGVRKQLRFDEDGKLLRQRLQGALHWEKERFLRTERGVNYASMTEQINTEIRALEAEHDVRVLFAVESGSRAWGFASPDSDYDVRLVYVRKSAEYLRLERTRDVIEWKLDDTLDINGWDLSKFLRLMRASNPSVFEWLASPIVYCEKSAFSRVRELARRCYSPATSAHHYYGMAKGTYNSHLLGERVSLKKYLYVTRALLAVRWAASSDEPVPMEFARLVDCLLEKELQPLIQEVVAEKMLSGEHVGHERIPWLDRWISDAFAECENLLPTVRKRHTMPWDELDKVFLEMVNG